MSSKNIMPEPKRMQDFGEDSLLPSVKYWVPTGNLALDVVLHGGWPCGRFSMVYGAEASGKSALAAIACSQVQKMGGPAYYSDPETTVDEDFFTDLGVNLDKDFFYDSPGTLTDLFEGRDDKEGNVIVYGIDRFVEWKNNTYGKDVPAVVVWDSIAATTTQEELDDRGTEERQYPDFARYLSGKFRTSVRSWAESNIAVIAVNQVRTKIGISFGDKKALYGGKAPNFYASVKLYLNDKSKIRVKKGNFKIVAGENIEALCEKHKLGVPFRFCEFPLMFNHGMDQTKSVCSMLKGFKLADITSTNIKFTCEEMKGEVIAKKDLDDWLKDEDNYWELYDILNDAFVV